MKSTHNKKDNTKCQNSDFLGPPCILGLIKKLDWKRKF